MSTEAEKGAVEINLDGNPKTLRATLKAAKAVSGHQGYQDVLLRLSAMDLITYVNVVAAGLAMRPVEVEAAVWKTGLPDLTEPLSRFVLLLANGGRSLTASSEG